MNRPDDEPIDQPDDGAEESSSGDATSREDRVRGGFFQSDAGRDPQRPDHSSSGDGQEERPADRAGGTDRSRGADRAAGAQGSSRRSSDDEEDNPFAFDPAAVFGMGRGAGRSNPLEGVRRRADAARTARAGSGRGGNGSTGWGGDGGGGGRGGAGARAERGRPGPLALTIGILVALAVLLGFLSSTWTEVLWFNQLGFSRIIWTEWISKAVLFVVGFALMFGAVFLAMSRAYKDREIHLPDDEAGRNLESYRTAIEPMRRVLLWGLPALLALLGAAWELVPSWREILLAMHSQSFGVKDPQFGIDVSFYVFILPVLKTIVGYLSRVTVFAGVASLVTHYLYGGVSVSRRPHFTRPARRHLAIFLAVFSVLQAIGYWLSRYSALYSSNSKFDGAGYADVKAVIPANAILAAIGLAIAVLFVVSIRARSWKLPVTGVVVSIVSALLIGSVYPAVIQKFVVDPNAQSAESPYISRNIKATLAAYGLDDVETTSYNAKTSAEAGQLKEDAESTTSIRLLDPNLVSSTFRQLQQNKQYYSFADHLNVDRYSVQDSARDTVIAVRELNLDGLDSGQRTWVNEHTVYTHGYGVVTAYGNTVASGGYPSFWEGGIPSQGDLGTYEPRVYFGQDSPSYSIVGGEDGGSPRELDYPDDSAKSGQVNTTFSGNGGPSISNPWNRLLYAVKLQEMNILFSNEVHKGSQILYDRDPAERVAKVAPWLTLDGNPYPAVVDTDGNPKTPKRVVWILDGYTTTNNYPYSQHESLSDVTADGTNQESTLLGAPDESNYVRNSVKAVVDAYDGSVKLYQWDDNDPVLRAWSAVFPGTVAPMSEMSADLMAHMRYPEDLFKAQRTIMAKYHVTNAADFYSGGDFWKVPDDPTKSGNEPQAPYYLTLKMPDQDKASFSLSSVYIIGGNTDRNVLTGFLAVDSETSSGKAGVRNPDYGKLRLLELPRSSNVSGPGQVQNTFDSDPTASQTLNLLSQQGSQVIKGNLLTLPVGGGLLYVQPVYVQSSSGTQYPLLRKVLVSFGDKVGFDDTLSGALNQVFGGDSGATTGEEVVNGDDAAANGTSDAEAAAAGAVGDTSGTAAPTDAATAQASATAAPSAGTAATAVPSGNPQAQLDQALSDAQTAMDDSDAARETGDWAAYGDAQKRLDDAVQRAVDAQNQLKK